MDSDLVEFISKLRKHIVADDPKGAADLIRGSARRFSSAAVAKRLGYDALAALRRFARSDESAAGVAWAGVLVALGNHQAAATTLRKLNPPADQAQANCLMAQMFSASGKSAEANRLLVSSIQANPSYAEPRYHLGTLLARQGRGSESIRELSTAAMLDPADVRYRMSLGNAFKSAEKHEKAVIKYSEAIRLEPGFADLFNNRGTVYQRLSRKEPKGSANAAALLEKALQDFERAIQLDPQHLFTRLNLGGLLLEEGRFADSAREFSVAVAINPTNSDAHYGIGLALQSQELHSAAIRSFDSAIICNPRCYQALFSKGNSLQSLNRMEDAIDCYRQALAVNPDYRVAYVNWVVALQELGRHRDVVELVEPVLAKWPDFNEVRWNLANSMLCFGPSEDGWVTYEARHALSSGEKLQTFGLPLLGQQSPAGRRIFVQWDQRFGDIIQMLRYIPLLEREAERCVWQVAGPMVDLVAASFPGIEIVKGGPPRDMAFRLPFTSLPLALRTFTMEGIPAEVPYLRPSPSALEKWRMARRPGELMVGLAWRGRPTPPGRSIDLHLLLPVLRRQGLRIVSLQSDCSEEEKRLLAGVEAIDLGDRLENFDDTAAVLSQLDLVISVDTAVSHLAGAMGKKLWVMLKWGGDWRWLLERPDSPWYPTAKIYRQGALRDWSSVVAGIDRDLGVMADYTAVA